MFGIVLGSNCVSFWIAELLWTTVHQLHKWKVATTVQPHHVHSGTRRISTRGNRVELHWLWPGSAALYWSDRKTSEWFMHPFSWVATEWLCYTKLQQLLCCNWCGYKCDKWKTQSSNERTVNTKSGLWRTRSNTRGAKSPLLLSAWMAMGKTSGMLFTYMGVYSVECASKQLLLKLYPEHTQMLLNF